MPTPPNAIVAEPSRPHVFSRNLSNYSAFMPGQHRNSVTSLTSPAVLYALHPSAEHLNQTSLLTINTSSYDEQNF
ncbi:hypothetical protein PF003_g3728 [Phytophthora fragariae]|nr:hypothetical protein PF003_g3728 [Phytophthora fragariae]